MRIALFTLSMFNGGAERVAAQLSCLWTQMGHEVVLATALPPTGKDFEHRCVVREVVDYARLDHNGMGVFCARHKLNAVVFNDGINAVWFPHAVLAAKNVGLKVVVICHHTANNWMYFCGNTRELELDNVLSKVDAMVNVDPMWALWWHHRGVRSFYIQNPVFVGENAGDENAGVINDAYPVLVWVGRLLDGGKQPEKMIDIFAKILQEVPTVKLYMLGTKTFAAERMLRNRLIASLGQLKVAPRMIEKFNESLSLPGFVANATAYMRKSTLHVFTSLTEVTVPQVVMEAQAIGLPTVALEMPVLRGASGVFLAKDVNEFVKTVVQKLAEDKTSAQEGQAVKRPTFCINERQSDVSQRWNELFCALAGGDVNSLVDKRRSEWQHEGTYGILLDELHRSQMVFTQRYLPEYLKWRRWRTRLNIGFVIRRVMNRFGCK